MPEGGFIFISRKKGLRIKGRVGEYVVIPCQKKKQKACQVVSRLNIIKNTYADAAAPRVKRIH